MIIRARRWMTSISLSGICLNLWRLPRKCLGVATNAIVSADDTYPLSDKEALKWHPSKFAIFGSFKAAAAAGRPQPSAGAHAGATGGCEAASGVPHADEQLLVQQESASQEDLVDGAAAAAAHADGGGTGAVAGGGQGAAHGLGQQVPGGQSAGGGGSSRATDEFEDVGAAGHLLTEPGEALGESSTGNVMAGRVHGHEAAVKLCDATKEPEMAELMQHEASVYEALPCLEGVVIPCLLAHGWTNYGMSYFVAVAWLRGEHPRRGSPVMQQYGPAAVLQAIEQALKALHGAHGDLHPDNILVQGSNPGELKYSRRVDSAAECEEELEQLREMLLP